MFPISLYYSNLIAWKYVQNTGNHYFFLLHWAFKQCNKPFTRLFVRFSLLKYFGCSSKPCSEPQLQNTKVHYYHPVSVRCQRTTRANAWYRSGGLSTSSTAAEPACPGRRKRAFGLWCGKNHCTRRVRYCSVKTAMIRTVGCRSVDPITRGSSQSQSRNVAALPCVTLSVNQYVGLYNDTVLTVRSLFPLARFLFLQ